MSLLTKCKEKFNCLKNLSSASKYKVYEEELSFASINQGNFKIAKILIDGKMNVNLRDYSDSTPLKTKCRATTKNQETDDILILSSFFDIEEEIFNLQIFMGKVHFIMRMTTI